MLKYFILPLLLLQLCPSSDATNFADLEATDLQGKKVSFQKYNGECAIVIPFSGKSRTQIEHVNNLHDDFFWKGLKIILIDASDKGLTRDQLKFFRPRIDIYNRETMNKLKTVGETDKFYSDKRDMMIIKKNGQISEQFDLYQYMQHKDQSPVTYDRVHSFLTECVYEEMPMVSNSEETTQQKKKSTKFSDLEGTTLDGKKIDFQKYKDKCSILTEYFGDSSYQTTQFNKLYNKYSSRGLEIIVVNAPKEESPRNKARTSFFKFDAYRKVAHPAQDRVLKIGNLIDKILIDKNGDLYKRLKFPLEFDAATNNETVKEAEESIEKCLNNQTSKEEKSVKSESG